MTTAAAERRALCETLDRVGGDAPTLSGDWDAAHLAAHLVVRESRPLDMLGIVVPALAGRTERATRRLATTTPFPALVERVRPARAILTNLHTDLDYRSLARRLPAGVEPAYDGLVAEVAC